MSKLTVSNVTKVITATCAAGILAVLVYGALEQRSTNAMQDNQLNETNVSLSFSKSDFSYLGDGVSLPTKVSIKTDAQLEAQLSAQFGSNVFVKNFGDAYLSMVVVRDKLLIVDRSGRYAFRGDMLDLESGVIISDVIKTELDTMTRLSQSVVQARLPSTKSFLEHYSTASPKLITGDVPRKVKKAEEAQNQTPIGKPSISVVRKPVAPVEERVDSTSSAHPVATKSVNAPEQDVDSGQAFTLHQLPMGYNNSAPVPPAILDRASKLRLSNVNFKDECLDLALSADTFVQLYEIVQAMPTDNKRAVPKKCGEYLSTKYSPVMDDSKLVIYKAPQERGSITVYSDFTCQFCKKFHLEIPQYLENGITVKVVPYGRASYADANGQQTFISKNMEILQCQTAENKARAMDELIANPHKYSRTLLEGYDPVTADCREQSFIYKSIGNILTLAETPLIVADTNEVLSGYLPSGSALKRLGYF